MRLLQLLLSLWIIAAVPVAAKHHPKHTEAPRSWEFAHVDWDESFDSFVPYSRHTLKHLPDELSHDYPPVFLDMIVNIAQWDQPLFALLKGIVARNHRVLATHHFFIQDGWIYNETTKVTSRCRDDTDGSVVPWENCTRHCTNGGRYCLNGNDKQPGHELVRESARRMCFDALFEPGSTILWEYLDHFEHTFHCHDAQNDNNNSINMTTCSYKVLDKILNVKRGKIHRRDVVDCVNQMGGLDGDGINHKLEQAIKSEKVPGLEHEAERLPILEINGQPYQGDFHVDQLFTAVCDAFPSDEPKPYACEFCAATTCNATRKCLWHLECDEDEEPMEPVPVEIAVVGSPASDNSSKQVRSFLIVIACLAVITVMLGFRQYRIWEVQNHGRWRMQTETEVEPRNVETLAHGEDLDVRNHGILV